MTDDESAGTAGSDGNGQTEGSTEGTSAGGQFTSGQSTDGQSASGQSTGGQSAGGQSSGQASGQTGGQAGGQTGGQAGGQTGGQAGGSTGTQPSGEMTGPAAGGTGLEPNVAAAIAYLFAPLTGVVMLLVEGDEDDFVRFHSIQSIGFGAVLIGLYVAIGAFIGFVSVVPFVDVILVPLVSLLYPVVGLGAFAGWVLLIFKAYQGERYALPVLGSFAASN
ncbi:DUF4870 domain-containing protein [Halosimplex marinum]|uniref:DUF4870 domain-containing protein n=1 Tax=Halosimplex marinum TaxID=3396620 RepID=UPI003F5525BE